MTYDAHTNLAISAIATAPSPATTGTSLIVTTGHGSRFPTAPFNATVCPAGSLPDPSNAEIVRVTARSTDTLTIVRAQEGTTARTIVTGDLIFAGITAKTLTDIEALTETHAARHATDGADPITITEAQVTGLTTNLAAKAPTTRTITAGTGLTGGGDLSADRTLTVTYGTAAGTAAQGNDARLSDARTPTSHQHAADDVTSGQLPITQGGTGAGTAADARTALGLGNSATRSVGTTAGTVTAGDDARLTDARTPTAHASSHEPAGSDPVTVAQSQVTGLADALAAKLGTSARGAADGVASLDSSTLIPTSQLGTGSADGTKVLSGDRTWATAVALAQAGQMPAQEPVAPGAASVGTAAVSARSDHVHPSWGSLALFGHGGDGAASFDGSSAVAGCSRSGSVYRASRDLFFTSATFADGVTLNLNGWRLFVRGVVAVPTGTATVTAITVAPSGTNQSVATTGLTNRDAYSVSHRNSSVGGPFSGPSGVTGVGVNVTLPAGWGASAGVNYSPIASGSSGAGGSGGSGAGGNGAGAGTANAQGFIGDIITCMFGRVIAFDIANAGTGTGIGPSHHVMFGGFGGGSGSGDGVNAGGAGGTGGGVVIVNAVIVTGTLNVTAPGSAGGSPTTGNCGGGGGGTGGVALLNSLNLTAWTGTVTAPGGIGGTGCGTGANGTGGSAGVSASYTWA